mgnify:CR=1 FL=1
MKYFEYMCIVLLLAILFILIVDNTTKILQANQKYENSYTAPIQLNITQNSVPPNKSEKGKIPLNIFQTWQDKFLPPKMVECVNSITQCNPEFNHYLYDDQECYEFIKTNFDSDVLYAYESLIPGAFKADLWRCCILYKYGGVYLDIKYKCVNGFKLLELTDDEYFVKDLYETNNRKAVYNAFIVAYPGNAILEKSIRKIVEHVRSRFYGSCPLDVTGPTMMIKLFKPADEKKLERMKLAAHLRSLYITYKDTPILMMYPEYRMEQSMFSKKQYYAELWSDRSIYE